MNQLTHIEKQAKGGGGKILRSVWGGMKRMSDASSWKALQDYSAKKTGKGWNAANRTARVMNSPGGKLLGYYGMGSMMGLDLPGGELVNNLTMPVWGAVSATTGGIKSLRMRDPANQQKLKDDAQAGARSAGADFLNVASIPGSIESGGSYIDTLNSAGAPTTQVKQLYNNEVKPMSAWDNAGALLTDPQKMINNRAALEAQRMINKQANAKAGLMRRLVGGVGKLFEHAGTATAPLMVAGAGYGLYDAVKGSPYDREQAQQTGYDAAQAGIAKRLDKMAPWERGLVKLDPTLAAPSIEAAIPGSLQAWEESSGAKFKPGLLGSLAGPSKPTFINAEGQSIS